MLLLTTVACAVCGNVHADNAIDFSGYAELQERIFVNDGLPEQRENYFSAAFNPQWRIQPDDDDALTLRLFARHDFSDSSRTHEDVRELQWQRIDGNQDWRIGVGEVFWGVVESRHLVDIINQQDYLEHFDGDAKLGQPLASWTRHGDNNNIEVHVLPYFREREFPDAGGRLRAPLPMAPAHYQSSAGEHHVDFAARWQWLGEGGDIALSYFNGTEREPLYQPIFRHNQLMIEPQYWQLSQWGLEAQKSVGNFLLKMEAVHRDADTSSWASVTGFEYTLDNIANGDLGLVLEYLRDNRETIPTVTFNDDIFAGVRFSTNTFSSTYILAGIYQDRTNSGRIIKLEANTRVTENVKLLFEAWRFDQLPQQELAAFFAKDDFFELSIQFYFD